MLNDYWAAVVPGIDAAGGEIEQFVGDAVMAAFNVEGDQPDHAQRATRAALAIIEAGGRSSRRIPTGRLPGGRQHRSRGGGQRRHGGRRSFAVDRRHDQHGRAPHVGGRAGTGRGRRVDLGRARRRGTGEPLGAVRVKGGASGRNLAGQRVGKLTCFPTVEA